MDPALLSRAESALSKARAAVDVEKRKAALFGSIAGKGTMADDLIKLFPPHKTYTEVFAGGAAVFWSKDSSSIEVLNDFDSEVAHAYKFAQSITDAQIKQLASKNWIGSKELFKKLRYSKPTDSLERFYRLIYLRKAGFSRGEICIALDKVGKQVASSLFKRLPYYRDRLRGVRIYSGDFSKPLTAHDGPDTLHFLDPPFPGFDGMHRAILHDWDEERFLKAMYALKGKFILTYETRAELNKEFRKRGYRVREWMPKENRGFNPNQEGRKKTTVVTNFERAVNKVLQVPGWVEKKTDQPEGYKRESALINENRKKPEANKAHDFKAADWTFPNGHPRCLVCGQEEMISGRCNDAKADERELRRTEPDAPELCTKHHSRTSCMSCKAAPTVEVLWADGRGHAWFCDKDFESWKAAEDRDIVAQRQIKGVACDKWSQPAVVKVIQIPIDANDDRLAAAVTRLAGTIGIQTSHEDRVALSVEEADRFVSGELDLLAAPRKGLPVGKSIDLMKDGAVIGSAELGKPEQIDLWRFAELTARHGISDDLRRERWPQAKKLHVYPVAKAEPKDPGYVEIKLSDVEADALDTARKLMPQWWESLDGFVRRQSMFLEPLDDERSKSTLEFVKGLPDLAKELWGTLKGIGDEIAKSVRSESAVVIGNELLKALRVVAPRLPASKSKEVVDRAIKVLDELDRLSREEFLRVGGHVPEAKRETAPVHPSGKKSGKEIKLAAVLPSFKPCILRRNVVTLVGGLANWGKSRNDVDLLIKGPVDASLRKIIEFRLGRMVPADVSQRLQFLDDDELGGPFTDHVELFDLWLVPRTHEVSEKYEAKFETIQMGGLAKADDPLMDLPRKRGKRPAVYQYHFRGRSLHGDLRLQVNDQLIGWTLANAKAGKVPAVSEVKDARRMARRFDRDGSFFEKDWTAPEGLFATPKGRMPRAWLDLDGEKFEPGEIGATANEPGVIVRVSDPDLRIEFGIQKAWAHEYFLTGDPRFSGRLFFRQLTGRGGEESEEEADRKTPRGETFWRSFWTKDLLPSVLNRRSVKRKTMPPDGYSALPVSLEAAVPAEFRYWESKGAEAREKRDALVEAKILTPEKIRIVDGEFRKITTKTFLDLGNSYHQTVKRHLVRYGLALQVWKSKQAIGSGPSRQVWHLAVERDDGKFDVWKLNADPMSADRVSGVYREIDDSELLTYNGEVKPVQKIGGEVLNDSKTTQSWIHNVDSGKAELIESSDGVRKLRFRGKLRGTYALTSEEPGSSFWMMELEEATAKSRSAGASVFVKRVSGFRFVECPACDAINLRLTGLRKTGDGSMTNGVECNDCAALFGVDGELIDRNAAGDLPDDLDGAPIDDEDYLVIKAVPVRNGIQIWDPIRKDDSADRTKLRPPAIYRAMKSAKSFDTVDDILERFATPAVLELGIMVEPRYEGDRLSLQKRASRVMVFKGDQDVSQSMPDLVKALRKMAGDFVLDGVADGDRVLVFDSLYADGSNVTDKRQAERRRKVEQIATGERILAAPVKVARTHTELIKALTWAYSERGSVGAVLKGVDATYSLSGDSDLWANLSTPAEVEPDPVSLLVSSVLSKRIPFVKTEEERFVLGIVLEPNDGKGGAPLDPDSQDDIYSAEEIRQAAHKFMEEYRNLGVMHSELANDRIKILESYIAPADFTIGGVKVRKGTWLLAVRIVDDTLWQRVKGGELTGFSIGGSAMRHPVKQ